MFTKFGDLSSLSKSSVLGSWKDYAAFAVTTDPFIGGTAATTTAWDGSTASSGHPLNDLLATVNEIWTDMVNEKTFNDTVLANFVTDLSAYAQDGGAILHVPNLYTNALTVSTQSTQGAEVTTASPAQTNTYLAINIHKYVAFIIGDGDMGQIASNYNVNELYVNEARRLLTEALEQAIAALWSSLTSNISLTSTTTALNDAEIRLSIYIMENNKYHLDECAFEKRAHNKFSHLLETPVKSFILMPMMA
jgi:hypothetical protein